MSLTKFKKDLILMSTCLILTACSIFIYSKIDFEKPKIQAAISESVTVHNLKIYTDYRLCLVTVGEQPVISFHGLFEVEKTEDYLSVKYNQKNIQYVYFMFPKGEIQFFTLVDNIPNNDYLYTHDESYEW